MSIPFPGFRAEIVSEDTAAFSHVYSGVWCWESGKPCCLGACEQCLYSTEKDWKDIFFRSFPLLMWYKCLSEFAFVCLGNTDNVKEAKEHSGEMGLIRVEQS